MEKNMTIETGKKKKLHPFAANKMMCIFVLMETNSYFKWKYSYNNIIHFVYKLIGNLCERCVQHINDGFPCCRDWFVFTQSFWPPVFLLFCEEIYFMTVSSRVKIMTGEKYPTKKELLIWIQPINMGHSGWNLGTPGIM